MSPTVVRREEVEPVRRGPGDGPRVAVVVSLNVPGADDHVADLMRSLTRYERPERNAYREIRPEALPRYSLVGSNLRLYPIPTAGLAGTILYAPEATVLVNAGDSVTYPNGWEKYIVVDAAIQALLKEESDTRALMAERERIEKEIREAKEARDMATPKRVVDVMMTDLDVLW